MVAFVVVSTLMLSISKTLQISFKGVDSTALTIQAQQYAASRAELIRKEDYSSVAGMARSAVAGTEFQEEIIVGSESDYNNDIKQKLITIKIYNASEAVPRVSLSFLKFSKEEKSGVPVGTIIAWTSSANPADGIWLECNGQSCATYPELVAVLGKNTVPDYRGRFLEGAATAGTVKEAGLPNITGSFGYLRAVIDYSYEVSGAFYDNGIIKKHDDGNYWTTGRGVGFDASRSSMVYGNSDTVQPPSVTVRYLIKAA